MTSKIDWAAVREAQKRAKYGRATPEELRLCERAWKADPDRYHEQGEDVRQEVFAEVALGAPFEKKVEG